jgi:thiamine-phosphate pyrophosphorylase
VTDKTVESARLYLVAPARIGTRSVASMVGELAAAGVDVLQLREKEMEAGDVLRAGAELAEACGRARIPFVVNDRPDLAVLLDAGVHVGQRDVPVEAARRLVPRGIVGLSTHAREEIDAVGAGDTRPDYIAVGPVFVTPTKPGRPAAGIDLVSYAAQRVAVPWFAIGGIDASNLPEVMEAGARRVVVVRAIAEARDPVAATAALRARLDEVPL